MARQKMWDDEEDMDLRQRIMYTLMHNLMAWGSFCIVMSLFIYVVYPFMGDMGWLPNEPDVVHFNQEPR